MGGRGWIKLASETPGFHSYLVPATAPLLKFTSIYDCTLIVSNKQSEISVEAEYFRSQVSLNLPAGGKEVPLQRTAGQPT